jgi:hypothetical protein
MGGAGSGRFGWRGGRLACEDPSVLRLDTPAALLAAGCMVSHRQSAFGKPLRVFHCPRCNRSIRVLFAMPGRGAACRTCLRLTYQSTRLSPARRYRQTASCLLARHGIEEADDGLCYRPRGMHRRTFDQVMDRVQALERRATLAERIPQWLAHLIHARSVE